MPEQNLAKKIVLDPLPPKASTTLNKTLNLKVHLNGVSLKQRKTTITKEEQTTTIVEQTTTTSKSTKTNQDNELIAKLVSPSGKEEDVFLTEIDENTCILSFKCREPGPNQLNVRLNGVHVTNSPTNFFVKKTTKTTSTTNTTNTTSDTSNTKANETTKTTTISDTQNTTQTKQQQQQQQQEVSSKTTKVTEETEQTTTINCTKTLVKITGLSKEVRSKQENVFIVNTQNAPMGK